MVAQRTLTPYVRVRILLPLPKRLVSSMQVSFFTVAIFLPWIRKTLTYFLINARQRAKPPKAVFEGSNPSPLQNKFALRALFWQREFY